MTSPESQGMAWRVARRKVTAPVRSQLAATHQAGGGARRHLPIRLWPRSRMGRTAVVAFVGLIVVLGALGVDAGVLSGRIRHVAITFPSTQEGTTWVLVGSDARSTVPTGPALYGTTAQAPGTHADAVLVVHQYDGHTNVLSIPRDVLVSPASGEISRLTLTLNQSSQSLVDGLCRSLNIPATHLVIINMRAFAGVVNAVGGVTITNPTPVRDRASGLIIPTIGRVHLGGIQALALVRSRNPQFLTAHGWVSVNAAAGDEARTTSVGEVFSQLAAATRARRADPLALQRLAWAITGGLTTDIHTGLFALSHLSLSGAHVIDVPVQGLNAGGIGAAPDAATYATLTAAGFGGSCQL